MPENLKDRSEYTPVIGMEIHVQLKTASKMFCASPNNPDETAPNKNICEICTGQPGTLPVTNEHAVRLGVMLALALNCKVPEYSKFDRKSYFYPDLPKGYQISQYDQPIAEHGFVDIELPGEQASKASSAGTPAFVSAAPRTKRIRIRRAHLEEDAGKNIHPEGLAYSLVDFNRAGTPLMEIVTEPDIESALEAKIFLQELRNIVRYIGAGSADMEKGTMRLEPNISVRKPGQQELPNYKVEVKNINSFKFAESAIEYEVQRQTEILKEGGTPRQVTMGWNEKASQTVEQRSKEESNDYRYFPEPDLPILHVNKQMREELLANIPELPAQKRSRFKKEYGLPEADIASLIDWKELNEYFEETVSELEELLEIEKSSAGKKNEVLNGDNTNGGNAANSKLIKMAANWCLQDCSALLNAAKLQPHDSEVKPENLAGLIKLIDQGKISITAGKQVFAKMFEHGGEASHIIEDLGLAQVSDVALIAAAVEAVIAAQPKAVADYKAGQQKSFGFLVGMVMRELQGKGNPQVVNEILTKKLN